MISPAGGLVGSVIFTLIALVSFIIFGIEVRHLLQLLMKSQPENRLDHLNERIGFFTKMVLGQEGVLRDPIPGIAHFFTFWGFIIISFGTLNLWLGAYNWALPVIGHSSKFASFVDIFVMFVFVAIGVFAYRRFVVRPRQLQSSTHKWTDGAIILGLIAIILLSTFGYDAFIYRATAGQESSLFGAWLGPLTGGMAVATAAVLTSIFWWVHVLTVLLFLDYLPMSKHMHLMATPFNIFFRNYKPKGALPLMENLETREDYGVSKIEQFTWKQLLDGLTCTECGRCNTMCPALATDKPLWPKEIILGVREGMMESGGGNPLLAGLGIKDKNNEVKPLVGGLIQEESLWACTSCGACMEICPVSIEHVPKIIQMRQHLVMEESSFPQEVVPLFNNLERNQNPWEISNDTRGDWAKDLGVKTLAEDPEVEVLYWVGCMASFDQRNRKVATALVKILQAANIHFGILGKEESCTGDPARRIGNEYMWQMLATQNIEVLKGYGFGIHPDSTATNLKTVITACPHCFNTIKNEYPQLGGNFEVVHHSEYIERLISEGKLKLPEGFDTRKLTYHDPCYIGRWNGIYDQPRKVLNVVNANGVNEMERSRNRSFCCGGGGGRVWMEEKIGKRINQTRVEEAMGTGADVVAAACPFCITMFEDGIKAKEAQETFKVEDIAEIVARALETAEVNS